MYDEPKSPDNSAEYRAAKDRLYTLASTDCIPWVIKLGTRLVQNKTIVDEEINFFQRRCPSLPPRIHQLYGLYKAIVHEVHNICMLYVIVINSFRCCNQHSILDYSIGCFLHFFHCKGCVLKQKKTNLFLHSIF